MTKEREKFINQKCISKSRVGTKQFTQIIKWNPLWTSISISMWIYDKKLKNCPVKTQEQNDKNGNSQTISSSHAIFIAYSKKSKYYP